MEVKDVNKGILKKVQHKEHEVIKNISWISISISFLYMCGYAWRVAYYGRLGVPVSFIDFNFPEILIPKPRLLAFIAQFLLTFLYAKYHSMYEKEKRLQRANKMGIDRPLNIILDYSQRKNAIESSKAKKTNHEVFYGFLSVYVKEKTENNPDWKFDLEVFGHEVLKLFPDIPNDIEGAFVSYELQLLCMDSKELRETVADSVGASPQSSGVFTKLILYFFYTWVIISIIGIILYGSDALWTLIYSVSGIGLGYALYKITEYEDRFHLWQIIWASIIVAIILSTIDGRITAMSSLKRLALPIVTITRINGNGQKGILLAHFDDGYVIFPYDSNDHHNIMKIHTHQVASVEVTTFGWLQQYIREDEEKSKERKEEFLNKSRSTKSIETSGDENPQ